MACEVSVVVPVYNTGVYLPRCVQSLAAQSIGAPEIILVDDGSADDSGEICDALAKEYPTVRVLHKENGGTAMARYDGTRIATGKYVTYVDSDDFVDGAFIERLYSAIGRFGAECACCGYREYFEDKDECGGEKYVADEDRCLDAAETFNTMFFEKKCFATVCCKLFLTERIREIEPMRIRLGEDSYVCIEYFLECKKIAHLNYAGLYYRQRSDSAVHAAGGVERFDYVRLYDALEDDFASKCPAAMPAFRNKFIEDNFVTYLHLSGSSETEKQMRRHILDNIKKYRGDVMRDPRAEKRTRGACLLSFVGLGAVSRVYRLRGSLKS
ncbi:MAG: glycosyltransferase [Clostridia bacterium]|nr:glycosyltransferase [Clostridia bacterium]MBR5427025.1 glycosyltransferase [Clostridia bacterium]